MQKHVLITGAGSGIGRATALLFDRLDYRLVLFGRRLDKLEETLAAAEHPERHAVASVDIRDGAAIGKALLEAGVSELHAVIANAGVGGENQYGANDRWQEVLDINLTGAYNTVMEARPFLHQGDDRYRHVVFVSSILARLGVPNYSAYCASKAGLLGLTRSLANQWANRRVLVNAVLPGWVDTEMARQGIQAFADVAGEPYEAVLAKQMAVVPTGKMAAPEEIAGFLGYLISAGQTSITGQALDMNNGALMP